MQRLKDKVAIITGSTSGMGRDTAYVFAEEGAKIVVCGRNEERAQEVVNNIKAKGGEAMYVIADMTDLEQVCTIFDKTMEAYGTVDILFNNAGLLSLTPSYDITLEEWDRVMTCDVTSALVLAQKVYPIMKEKGSGSIINTSSVAGISARYGTVAYCTAKHAMNGLTVALAREMGPEVRCNAIAPGAILTAMVDSIGGIDTIAPMIASSPLNRAGSGREIGKVALFLATDESSYITGQIIRVDGGIDA